MLMDPLSIEAHKRINLKIMIRIFYHNKYFSSFYNENNFTFLHDKFIRNSSFESRIYSP